MTITAKNLEQEYIGEQRDHGYRSLPNRNQGSQTRARTLLQSSQLDLPIVEMCSDMKGEEVNATETKIGTIPVPSSVTRPAFNSVFFNIQLLRLHQLIY